MSGGDCAVIHTALHVEFCLMVVSYVHISKTRVVVTNIHMTLDLTCIYKWLDDVELDMERVI